ncbi:3-alpha-hydroxysteroid dehydrogenase [Pueribacillus theae]|uniref:3-alpha-hydroxysteroid dehydrogenase n=1 Tax=Pueribacillus theae TaxID=2171751 RepID=A0A2U1JRR9_9BACI|nr:glucose 1-dehydrogenase [Pueribacillus theae]PWA07822.1 3-alpha-hydroxysteroid dehydrogenase [Pueribacillus theae]
MGRLNGKVAVITGAAGGLGESYVRKFVAEGAKVVFTDILLKEGLSLEEELGNNTKFIEQNISMLSRWKHVIQETEKTFGPVNILVNNAGIALSNTIEEMSEEEYRQVIDVNQVSVFLGMKAVLPSMKKAEGGSIVNVSSIMGLISREKTVAYTASKFAIRGMTKTAALEFAKYNIRVNSVHPGSVRTAITDLVYKNQEELEQRERAIPLHRIGRAEEVSNMVLYLASDESSYSTGSEFIIDGGLLAK